MAAKAGRLVAIKVSGEAVSFTDEATTTADDTTYQITDAAKRVWDRSATVTVEDGGSATAEAYTVNRLAGTITFGSADNTRVITVSGSYLPMSTLAEGHDVELTCTATNGDESVFGDADVVRSQLFKDCAGSIGRFGSVDTYLADAFDAEVPVVVEFSPDGGTTPHFRAWALLNKSAFQGARKTYLEESVSFEGAADVDGRSHTWLNL